VRDAVFTFANDFENAAKAAANTMTGNVAELKDCGGMVLVRDGTPESDERQRQPGLLMIPFEAGGVRYWICSR
jgi:hypothetical protein